MRSSESDFIAECEEIIEEAGRLLVEIQENYEQGVDPDTINALFRSMHTLKGIGGLFGRKDISDISHSLESLLDDIRLGKCEMTEEAIDLFLRFTDILRKLVSMPEPERPQAEGYINEIESFREAQDEGPEESDVAGLLDESILKVLSEYEEHRLKSNIKDGKGIYMIKPVFSFDDFDTALGDLTGKIKSAGELISTMPTAENVPEGHIGFNLMFGSPKPSGELSEVLKYDVEELVGSKRAATKPVPAPTAPTPAEAPERTAESLKTASNLVRVDISKLDRILNTIGEISLTKSAINRIWSEMNEKYGHSPLVLDIYRINQKLGRKISELQSQMLQIRMVPLGQIYSRLSQVIRRYSREAGKKIDLRMFGEDTELDKYLAEEIVDPLVHIVRNAIDHGLEHEQERVAAGKTAAGNIAVRAFQRGNHVVIEVSDDGRGIDAEHLRRKAVEKGFIYEGSELSDKEAMELLFLPGFSTKEVVSETSGRGVGLDIVKERLSSLGGFVDVMSEKGMGTIFNLTLPITLAIIKVLLVRVGEQTYAVPLSSIAETLTIRHTAFQSIENRKVFNLRNELLPVTFLKDIFRIEGDADKDRSFAVIVGFGERRMGLLVDELLGQSEVVIKNLGDFLEGVKGVAGAAEISRDETVLVLDVEGIIEETTSKKGVINV